MESEIHNTEVKQIHPVFKVTTLSKYLALILFILMPFVGGYVGYVYAPEKVVEVEKITTQKNTLESDRALLPNYVQVSGGEKSALQDQFINVEKLLEQAPFQWEITDPYREDRLLELNSDGGSDCYAELVDCKRIVVTGDTYFHRSFDTAQGTSTEEFTMTEIADYLKSQDFIFTREVAKGWQFEETYQRIIGDKAQIINISSKPINIVFPEDGSYPTADGTESRIFVSSIFEVPKD